MAAAADISDLFAFKARHQGLPLFDLRQLALNAAGGAPDHRPMAPPYGPPLHQAGRMGPAGVPGPLQQNGPRECLLRALPKLTEL